MSTGNKRKVPCPSCGSEKVRPYAYGLIHFATNGAARKFSRSYVSGGCEVGEHSPALHCDSCGKDSGKQSGVPAPQESSPHTESGFIREIIKPLGGQYARPWMTKLKRPLEAEVFIIGRNNAVRFPSSIPRRRYVDSLFNRNGESCRGFYDEIREGKATASRSNIEELANRLYRRGIKKTLETNVIAYSSRMFRNLTRQQRREGKNFFCKLLHRVRPLEQHKRGQVRS